MDTEARSDGPNGPYKIPDPSETHLELLEAFLKERKRSQELTVFLENAERFKDTVRPHIYEKVRNEYVERKQEADRHLKEYKAALTKDYREYSMEMEERKADLDEDMDRLQELEFRCRVGEYTEDEILEECRVLKKRIDEHRSRVSWLEQTLARFSEAGIDHAVNDDEDSRVEPLGADTEATDRACRPSEHIACQEGVTAFVIVEDLGPGEDDIPVVVCREDVVREDEDAASVPPQDAQHVVSSPSYVNGYITVLDGSRKGERFPLISSNITVGSSPGMDIRFEDPGVANFHARVIYKDHRYLLENLDSVGRCYVNAVRVNLSELKDGDIIRLGDVKLRTDFVTTRS